MSYERARAALYTYYQAAMGKLPVSSFNEMVEHYRTHRAPDGEIIKHDDFLESLDSALKFPNKVDTTTAMKNLAAATPKGKLPNTQAFFKSLIDQVSKLTASEFTSAVGAGLKDAAKTAAIGIGAGVGIYVMIAVGALLLPSLLQKLGKAK